MRARHLGFEIFSLSNSHILVYSSLLLQIITFKRNVFFSKIYSQCFIVLIRGIMNYFERITGNCVIVVPSRRSVRLYVNVEDLQAVR